MRSKQMKILMEAEMDLPLTSVARRRYFLELCQEPLVGALAHVNVARDAAHTPPVNG